MTDRKLASAFACGLLVGLAVAFVLLLAGWIPSPAPRVPSAPNDADSLTPARVRIDTHVLPPQVRIQLDVPIDPEGVWILGSPRRETDDLRFEAIRIEASPGLVAYKVWEGDGFTGYIATLCFGPDPKDFRVRVDTSGDVGPPLSRPWDWVDGRIQLSTWPADRPGAIIAFDFEGGQGDRALTFAGKFRVLP